MTNTGDTKYPLSDAQIEQFIRDGFIKLENAFPRVLADEARAILWRDTGCDPDDPTTWARPSVRLGLYSQEPFIKAANTSIIHKALDQLVGEKCWLPRTNLGMFMVRFPSRDDPVDTGWHIDVGFPDEASDPNDYFTWHANVNSNGRALLMLFLFSDVGRDDAPTRIRAGSHLDVARMLAPAGERGLSLKEMAVNGFSETAGRPEVLATGEAGTVYLCHPFLVHAAQPHRGKRPRFIAQPPLLPAAPFSLNREDRNYSPVERAIRNALRDLPDVPGKPRIL